MSQAGPPEFIVDQLTYRDAPGRHISRVAGRAHMSPAGMRQKCMYLAGTVGDIGGTATRRFLQPS